MKSGFIFQFFIIFREYTNWKSKLHKELQDFVLLRLDLMQIMSKSDGAR